MLGASNTTVDGGCLSPSERQPSSRLRRRRRGLISVGLAVLVGVVAVGIYGVASGRANHPRTNHPYALAELLSTSKAPTTLSPAAEGVMSDAVHNLPSMSNLTSMLQSQGVSLTVGGTAVSVGEISLKTLANDNTDIQLAASNAQRNGLDVGIAVREVDGPTMGLDAGVAVETLEQMLWDMAQSEGTAVTTAEATSFAKHQYSSYEAQATPPPLPAGTTAQQEILSPQAIQGYRMALTDNQQMTAISGTAGPTAAGAAALKAWMQAHLHTTTVHITGVPGVTSANVAQYLPSSL